MSYRIKPRLFFVLTLIFIASCTVSIIAIKNSEEVKIENDVNSESDVDFQKKDSIGIELRTKTKN